MLNSLVTYFSSAVLLSTTAIPLADVYVDASSPGCPGGTGSMGSPVCTIGAAVALAAPGDTIRIAPGVYIENVTIGIDLNLVGTGGATVTTVDGNAAGSVFTIPAAVTVTVDGLTVTNGQALEGGGIQVDGSLTLRNSTVTNCTSMSNFNGGGGIGGNAGGAVVAIENCTISNNSAVGDGIAPYPTTYGGGVHIYAGTLTITDSTISGNDAISYGGGVSVRSGTLTVAGATINNNMAGDFGGGVSTNQSVMTMTNCTVSGNQSDNSGGIDLFNTYAGSMLSNTTVTANDALSFGGGVYSIPYANPTDALQSRNTIISGNTAGSGDMDVYGAFASLGHNFVGIGESGAYYATFTDGLLGDQVGTDLLPIDPLLGPLLDNTGPTHTHALMTGSPAIDTGDAMFFEPFDQRGVSRPLGTGPDIGSFESDGSLNLRGICTGDGGNQMGCTNCPCGNNAVPGSGGGCLNSSGFGARIIGSGDTSVSLPPGISTDLAFSATGLPALAFAILNAGDGVGPTNPANPCFGMNSGTQAAAFDGLRCAIGNTRRHGGRSADVNGEIGVTNSPWGGSGGPPVGLAQAGGGYAAGQTRFFQIVHRDDELAVCMRGLNTSQVEEVTFTP